MTEDIIGALYEVVKSRKISAEEGSYTAYLFAEGIDKILKKVGEETSEVLIAAKNGDGDAVSYEICDLIYHLLVLMAEMDIPLESIISELENRRAKIGNLKPKTKSDKIS